MGKIINAVLLLFFIVSSSSALEAQRRIGNPIYSREVNDEVLKLQEELKEMQDSIAGIQQRLIGIIETGTENYGTRHAAIGILASIHEESVVEYLIKNEKDLRFGEISSDDDDQQMELNNRSALSALYEEYASDYAINWVVLPHLLKYHDSEGFSEIGYIRQIYGYGYDTFKDPWYLVKFMQANAQPGFKTMIDLCLEELEQQGGAKD